MDNFNNAQQTQPISNDTRWDRFAVALKTGSETGLDRAPIQLMTFLRKVNNMVLIGDSPETFIGQYPVEDVYTGSLEAAYDALERAGVQEFKKEEAPIFREVNNGEKPKRPKQQQQQKQEKHRRLARRADLLETQKRMQTAGWRLDAHKNVPGVRVLYEKYPQADWFIMIDDDTYIFLSNLEHYVKDLDPNEPHYLGFRNMFRGCDGVKKFGDGPLFAHGGSGIIMSRKAVEMLLPYVDKCIVKYKECWGMCFK
jgi:hypothetical protein